VIEFAELEEFSDLKVKNYSSGMLVRLAFSVMLQADADILLIDEVLAVGDAAFQQKCADAFHEIKAEKTIILVTHEMATVERYCDRAMLIDSGHVQKLGDPGEVGRGYLALNFERGSEVGGAPVPGASTDEVRLLDAWLENDGGERVANAEGGEKIRIGVELEVLSDSSGLALGCVLSDANGVGIFEFGIPVEEGGELAPLCAGERVTIRAEVENLLTQGRYFIDVGVNRSEGRGVALFVARAIAFVVYAAPAATSGIVVLPHEIEATIERKVTRR
jgi:energy-coupling factor transporter ATP-binding protein EcfA2